MLTSILRIDDFGFSFEKTGILVHTMIREVPSISVLKLCKMHDPKESIVCLDSHLKSIQLIGFKEEENEIKLLRFFLKNARILEKPTIVWTGYDLKSEEAFEEGFEYS
ncbi:hypothetical protein RDI58_028928 [Solanum bulbocastanum]|uniref:FBD domain-containing protein n=1 Tax=Solanum bulbocastanum TaxID=147425 RepID=A0AAN8SR02_SOLBU